MLPSEEAKMKNIIKLTFGIFPALIILFFATNTLAITDGCASEVDINTPCVIRTPPITCSTYSIYNATGNLTLTDRPMQEILPGSGVFNFTFVGNGTGVYSIVLCDNTSTQINVETTDETDLATILSNQATLQNNIETVNDTVKAINLSILGNLTLQHDALISTLNLSILENISISTFTSTVSPAVQEAIGLQCAVQTLRANLSITFGYNESNLFLLNASYNYTGLEIFINESYEYDNLSFLKNVTRRDHLG